ncbi:MAG: hypothetical protein V3S69_06250 [Dehalococcoidales bacterium]
MPHNKIASEMGADMPNRMSTEKIRQEEMQIQKDMGFGALEESTHGKSSMVALPEHPRKEM